MNGSGREILEMERRKAAFSPREMTYFLEGDEKTARKKEKMMLDFERDPTFKVDDYADMSRAQVRERIMTRARNLTEYLTTESVANFRMRLRIINLIDPGFMTRVGVHYALFCGAIQRGATEEQLNYWLGRGCFGMTELGHGSNVAGLETTATFDANTDEFVIHSPTITSTKWWIGGAAESATHCCVFARLIVKGKDYGVKNFIVPLRNPDDFALNVGVNIGDCGAKMGRNGIDNGWIQFTNVRIPRTNMLMKHTKVTRDGDVIEPALPQLTYGALILGRVTMIAESSDAAKKALTIAVRYSAVRRQFSTKANGTEDQILDYQTHQQRLLPLLATTFAMHFAAVEVGIIFDRLTKAMETTNPKSIKMHEVIESLKETHATSAGLKAFCTWKAVEIIEECRQALGGHGYSSYAGLSSMYQDFVVQCTWEGDNTVLMLQAGRYLINCYKDFKLGKKLPEGVAYINDLKSNLTKTFDKKNHGEFTLSELSLAFDVVRSHLLKELGEEYERLISSGISIEAAYEKCAIQRMQAAKIHCIGYLFQRFVDGVNRSPSSLKLILTDLCLLYGLSSVKDNSGPFLQFKFFVGEHLTQIQRQILSLFERSIRPSAVALVDSFNLTDYVINSPLGRYDGDIYNAYFHQVKSANPPKKHEYFERVLKPLFSRDLNKPSDNVHLDLDLS